jgi:hypothetical protein
MGARIMIGGRREGPLLEWLEQTLAQSAGPESAATRLADLIHFDTGHLPALGAMSTGLTEQLTAEYALRLVDGVLARAAKGSEEGANGGR